MIVYTNHLWCLSVFVFRKTPEFLSQAASQGAFASVPRRYYPAVGTNQWLICGQMTYLLVVQMQIVTHCDTMSHHVTQIVTQFSPRYLKYCQ